MYLDNRGGVPVIFRLPTSELDERRRVWFNSKNILVWLSKNRREAKAKAKAKGYVYLDRWIPHSLESLWVPLLGGDPLITVQNLKWKKKLSSSKQLMKFGLELLLKVMLPLMMVMKGKKLVVVGCYLLLLVWVVSWVEVVVPFLSVVWEVDDRLRSLP